MSAGGINNPVGTADSIDSLKFMAKYDFKLYLKKSELKCI